MKIISVALLALATVLNGAVFLMNARYEVPNVEIEGKPYLRADALGFLGFRYVGAGDVGYLMYGKHTLKLKSDGTVLVDFVDDTVDGGCVYQGGFFYVSADVLKRYVDLRWYRTPNGNPIFLERVPNVEIRAVDRGLGFFFDSEVASDMVNVSENGTVVSIVVSPVSTVTGSDVDYEFDGMRLEVEIGVDSALSVNLEYSTNTVILNFAGLRDFFGEKEIADGVVWRRVREVFNGREYVVSYVDIDLDKARVEPVLARGGVGSFESVKSMVERTGALLGVNANYFDPNTSMIIGLLVKNGKVLSGKFGSRPVFLITNVGATVRNDYLEIIATLGNVPVLVKGVNTIAKGEVLMYTSEFGLKIPIDVGKVYFLAKDGRIVSRGFKERLEPGETLIGVDMKYSYALKDVKVGDPFEVFVNTSLDEKVLQAVEAGPLLIKDGAPLEKPSAEKDLYSPGIITSRRARTIVAVKDRKHITLIVVENGGKGMNYNDMVEFLKDKGYEYAMCLDGGKSSSLVIEGEYVNLEPGQPEPKVPVGLLVWRR